MYDKVKVSVLQVLFTVSHDKVNNAKQIQIPAPQVLKNLRILKNVLRCKSVFATIHKRKEEKRPEA